jgi:hypothetical protein
VVAFEQPAPNLIVFFSQFEGVVGIYPLNIGYPINNHGARRRRDVRSPRGLHRLQVSENSALRDWKLEVASGSSTFCIDGAPELEGCERRMRSRRSISDPQEPLPLAKVALEAHTLGNLEA